MMTHNNRIVPALMTLPSLALIGGCRNGAKAPDRAPGDKPNIVLIVADDLGVGDVSCFGHGGLIPTPNLDALAANGIRFDNAYATSATSSPSRYGMFTGMYPWKVKMDILPGDAPLMIPVDMPTMPKMMQANGYATGAVGKWHLGMGQGTVDWNQPLVPSANTVGFDFTNLIPATVDRVPTVYVENGVVQNLDPNDPIRVSYGDDPFPGEITGREHPELMEMAFHHGHDGTIINGIPRIGHMMGGEKARWDDKTMASYFLGKAKGFIDEHADEPFFLYYGLHEPHVPRSPQPEFVGATPFGPRGDVVVELDWLVGEIVAHLEKQKLLDNTIIIFTSDNGAVVQDGYKDHSDELIGDHDPHAGLRGGKYSLYDGGTHIPMILSWNGQVAPAVSDAYVCQLDFFASLASLIGGEVPQGIDSEDHLDAFLGKDKVGREAQVFEATGKLGYRKGDYVLMPPYKGAKFNITGNELGALDEYGLFNIAADRHQDNNIAQDNAELLESLKNEFETVTGRVKREEYKDAVMQ